MMEAKHRNINVSLYITVMIAGRIVCNLAAYFLGYAAVYGWDVNWGLLILGILIPMLPTVYHFCVLWFAVKDYNEICRLSGESYSFESPNYLVVFLLSGVSCGIYGFYWFYKYGNHLKELGSRKKVLIRESGSTYLWMVLIPRLVSGVLCLIMMIFSFAMISSANSFQLRAAVSSGVGTVICSLLLMIALACSWILECLAWGKWLRNLQYIMKDMLMSPSLLVPDSPLAGQVRILTGQYKDAVFPVQHGEEVILGREQAKCHLVFQNEKISRVHCGIRYEWNKNGYLVTDYSMNGTFMQGGVRLPKYQPTLCQRGSMLELGESGEAFMLL